MTSKKTTIHHEGTISYWSAYDARYVRHASLADLADREIAAMPARERDRVLRAVERARGARAEYRIEALSDHDLRSVNPRSPSLSAYEYGAACAVQERPIDGGATREVWRGYSDATRIMEGS